MMLIGVDYHPSFQQIAFFVEETGECGELQLNHSEGEAERFYRDLQQRGIRVRVGMEATGYSRWFGVLAGSTRDRELWIGDPAEIKSKRVKKQKTDRRDALLLLRLLREDNFPQIWVPRSGEVEIFGNQQALASPPARADAHADHESVAGVGDERRPALENPAAWSAQKGEPSWSSVCAGSLRRPASERTGAELLDRLDPIIGESNLCCWSRRPGSDPRW